MLTGSGHSTPRHANVKPLTKRSSISLLYAQNRPSQVKLKLDFSGRSVNVKRRSMNIKHYTQILKIKLSEGQITEDTTLRLVNFISVSQSNQFYLSSSKITITSPQRSTICTAGDILDLRPSSQVTKKQLGEKNKIWKNPQEETQRTDPSPRTERCDIV